MSKVDMNILGWIVIPREDTVAVLEEMEYKHLFNEKELIDLAKENASTEKVSASVRSAKKAIKLLRNEYDFAVIEIVR